LPARYNNTANQQAHSAQDDRRSTNNTPNLFKQTNDSTPKTKSAQSITQTRAATAKNDKPGAEGLAPNRDTQGFPINTEGNLASLF
jgi:hypothetical protein